MTTHKCIALMTFSILLFGCRSNNHVGRPNNIQRIVFATGGCFGECPIQAIDIDSSLNVKYHGVKYTERIGFYLSKIDRGFWDTLNAKFEHINYKALDSSYEHSVDDLSTEIYIYYNGNKTKHIIGQSTSLPDSVMTTYNWLLKSIKQMNFTHTTKKLSFPTHDEKPIPMPSNIDSVMFRPPTLKELSRKSYR